ncbi:Rho termination factor [Sinomicrobium pectinilyticum]|uniref:Rho termination factor n=1 Tax=Sinomicrobium pectinilyticum TaxID=1084421 RepID=A0A3N0EH58_SINP1|nr:Rho termination factor N-terminal domain-containing protein [Sinomicrobium pectinilyticum]RNL87220.1 Rho termination factor [Sinomicrobium pectinilyticum]
MAKDHGPQIKDDEKYEKLREEGMSKTKAARIANTPDSGEKGGRAKKYEERSRKDLYEKAKQIGIKGRSKMNKKELIKALRNSK